MVGKEGGLLGGDGWRDGESQQAGIPLYTTITLPLTPFLLHLLELGDVEVEVVEEVEPTLKESIQGQWDW